VLLPLGLIAFSSIKQKPAAELNNVKELNQEKYYPTQTLGDRQFGA